MPKERLMYPLKLYVTVKIEDYSGTHHEAAYLWHEINIPVPPEEGWEFQEGLSVSWVNPELVEERFELENPIWDAREEAYLDEAEYLVKNSEELLGFLTWLNQDAETTWYPEVNDHGVVVVGSDITDAGEKQNIKDCLNDLASE